MTTLIGMFPLRQIKVRVGALKACGLRKQKDKDVRPRPTSTEPSQSYLGGSSYRLSRHIPRPRG